MKSCGWNGSWKFCRVDEWFCFVCLGRFAMNLTAQLKEPYHSLSIEECKGAYVRSHPDTFSVHMMTSTAVQVKGEGKKERRAHSQFSHFHQP